MMKIKTVKTMLILSLVLMMSSIAINSVVRNVNAARPESVPDANVLIFANATVGPLTVSLGLDEKIHVSVFNGNGSVNDSADLHAIDFVNDVDVIIIDGYLPEDTDELNYLMSNINGTLATTSVLFFGGNYSFESIEFFSRILPIHFFYAKEKLNDTLSEFFEDQTGETDEPFQDYFNLIMETNNEYEIKSSEIQISTSDEQDEILDVEGMDEEDQSMYVTRIAWQSCPLLYDRIRTYSAKTEEGAQTLVEVPNTKEPLVVTWQTPENENVQVIFVSTGTGTYFEFNKEDGTYNENEWNVPFKLWPYFNYMMYAMVFDLYGLEDNLIESYALWPYSPIPHAAQATIWMIFVASLWVFNFVLFFSLGKKKKKRNSGDIKSEKDADGSKKDEVKSEESALSEESDKEIDKPESKVD